MNFNSELLTMAEHVNQAERRDLRRWNQWWSSTHYDILKALDTTAAAAVAAAASEMAPMVEIEPFREPVFLVGSWKFENELQMQPEATFKSSCFVSVSWFIMH